MPLKSLSNADLKLLSVFRTVARCGGFSLAQADLNVSQATISIQIKDLETRLGLTLCQRGRGGFALTEDGQRVYDASNALFNHIEDFLSLATGQERLVGELQIAVVDNSIFHPTFQIGDVVRSFGEIDHNVDITIHVAAPNQLEFMVLSGQAHVAVGYFARRLAQLEYEPSFTSEKKAVTTRTFATCHCRAVTIQVAAPPVEVIHCNCSLCRRYGVYWAYYELESVKFSTDISASHTYAWNGKNVDFHRCRICGCVTHWLPRSRRRTRIGINARLFEPEILAAAITRYKDAAGTAKFS